MDQSAACGSGAKIDDVHGGKLLKGFATEQTSESEHGEKQLNYQSLPGGDESEKGLQHDDDKENLFEKCLTAIDVCGLNFLIIAAKDGEKYCPFAAELGGTTKLLQFQDEDGKLWKFDCSYVCRCYKFTAGWSCYVKEKQLCAGDYVFFQRNRTDSNRLFIGCRRREKGHPARRQQDYLQCSDQTSVATSCVPGDSFLPNTTLHLTSFGDDADECPQSAVLNPISSATSQKPQLRLHEDNVTGFKPILVIYCGDNQDSEETYLISYIFNELCLRGFSPLRYDLTRSIVTGNQETLYRSRVGIMIFSENYTLSRQYLDEVMAIMDHLKAKDLMLIPVYFKVSLSDVRNQSGSVGRAFLQSIQGSQVQKWRAAMVELTSINGYLYMKGDEIMLAKNIVRDICLLLSSETNGIKHPLESILPLLDCPQPSASQIVGLWGIAGIGKTTITREIFRTQAERYDVCYFLPDFDLTCQAKGMSHLRDEFYSKIFGEEKICIDACDTKQSYTKDRLLDKRALIILDGVSNARDAEVLVGGFGWFSARHTIILTSRNRQVLIKCKVNELYEIPKLSKAESFRLCCQYATEQYWKGNMPLISDLAEYASGIPLALRVLALSVKKQCINNEKEHMRRLSQHPPMEIQDAFEKSSNGIDENEKNIFLDIACFFRGENKDHVVNILDGCGFFTDLGICGLIDESLISLVENRIEMPNIFQDMGRFVVCQENQEAGKRSRLWDSNDIADVLMRNSGTEAIEGIFLDVSGLPFDLDPTVFERMYRLRLLKLHCPPAESHCKVCLPQGLHSLPDELRLLHWERYPLGSLPRNFNPKNLVELNMPYSNLTKLWKGTKNLEKLKRITLSHAQQLIKFPRLSKAKNLEHIDLEGCTSLVKVNSSILHHHKLTFLSLKDCSRLRIMPTTVHLESLEVLNLSGCLELEDIQGFSANLTELHLAGTAIKEIPSSIADLTRLVTLDLENCDKLQHLPPEINNLKAVVTLSVKHPASSMETKDLSSVICTATNLSEVQLDSTSMSVNDPSYKSFTGFDVLPERSRQPECQFYMRGYCIHGNACRFRQTESSLSSIGLPSRPGKHLCPISSRTGNCNSGPTCMFDHPTLVSTHKNTSSMASETQNVNLLGLSLTLGAPSSELVEASTEEPHKNIFSMASEIPKLNSLGFSSSLGDSSSEIAEASTKKPRIHKNTSSMASVTQNLNLLGLPSSFGASSSELAEASTEKPRIHNNTSSLASETPYLNLLGVSSSFGASSSELVQTSTKKPRIAKNTSLVASERPNLNPLGFSSLGDSSSMPVQASTASEITQATDGKDTIDLLELTEEEFLLMSKRKPSSFFL